MTNYSTFVSDSTIFAYINFI